MKQWLAKGWVQWLIAATFFFLLSWLYLGRSITDCSTSSVAFNSDSTGGFGWFQWIGGNDLSWDYSTKTNFPYGESVDRPHFITSTLIIFIYKIFATFTTPTCGINLLILLGYMSTALVMFGFIKWLLRRPDIALFAGYAAAFVPYHQLKSTSHITYVYGSFFIGIIWAYFWFISKPSYRRGALLGLIGASGFYFDGYFIFISGVMLGALFVSSFLVDVWRLIFNRRDTQKILKAAFIRLRYLAFSALVLALLLLPILSTYISQGDSIKQSLATARSNIRTETLLYGLRPIEFILPSFNNPIMSDGYPAWRATKYHGSNSHEATLFVGYTILLLGTIAYFALFFRKARSITFKTLHYQNVVFVITLVLLASLILALPAEVTVFGQVFSTPTAYLVQLTASWRVLARLFLAIDPLLIMLAALGLYVITKGWRKIWQVSFVTVCGVILFFEYLPSPLGSTGDLYKDSPEVYRQLAKDPDVDLIAEYPLADFSNSPSVFTFQQVHNKNLLNGNAAEIIKGPLHSSIAGLNDPQTLGALKMMGIDVVTTYGFDPKNSDLTAYYPNNRGRGGIFSYTISRNVPPLDTILILSKGYESLFVDERQISHRAITGPATMKVFKIWSGQASGRYTVSFNAQAVVCDKTAQVTVDQAGKNLWSGSVGADLPVNISFTANGDKPINLVPTCSLDITFMSAKESAN